MAPQKCFPTEPLNPTHAGRLLPQAALRSPRGPGARTDKTCRGWLLERRNTSHKKLAHAFATSCGKALFWRRLFFAIEDGAMCYWNKQVRHELQLSDVECVSVDGKDIELRFTGVPDLPVSAIPPKQRYAITVICLRAVTEREAEHWGASIRAAAALPQLRRKIPSTWNARAGFGVGASLTQLAVKVPLQASPMAIIQQLVDHTFIGKRTKDRCQQEVPVCLEVAKVVEVQNARAWVEYVEARARVGSTARGGAPLKPEVRTATLRCSSAAEVIGDLDNDCHERWLFHGTTPEAVQDIAEQGFALALAGSHRGIMYGQGIYLAECSSKADEYADKKGLDGLYAMLLCRAALGNVLVDSAKCPDTKAIIDRCASDYHSVCGDRWAAVGTFREFVFYDASQVYPAYVIYYRRTTQARLMHLMGLAIEREDMQAAHDLTPLVAQLAMTHSSPLVRMSAWEKLDALVSMKLSSDDVEGSAPARWILDSGRPGLVVTAARILIENGNANLMVGAVPALTEYLGGNESVLRERAASCLGQIGDHAVPVLPQIVQYLNAENSDVRTKAATVLSELREVAVPVLVPIIEVLRHTRGGTQEAAAMVVGQLGPVAAPALRALTECLWDESGLVRMAAVRALGQVGAEVSPALPALIERLTDSDTRVSEAAVAALEQIGAHIVDLIPALAEYLRDDREYVRHAAATVLQLLASHSNSAVTVMIDCLKERRAAVCCSVAKALGHCSAHADIVVPALGTRLRSGGGAEDSCAGVRTAVLVAFSNLGIHATPAVPDIIKCLEDESEDVQLATVQALGAIGQHDALAAQTLIRCLEHDLKLVQCAAIDVIGLLGTYSREAVPGLCKCLQHELREMRCRAATAFGQLGSNAVDGVPTLVECLKDENEDVRKAVVVSLGQLGMCIPAAAQALVTCISDDSAHVRIAASAAFGELGENSALVVPALTESLKDESMVLRRAAAAALGQLGPHAIAAAPMLAECVVDEDDSVCRAATTALMKLGANAALAVPVLVRCVACQKHWKNDRALKVLRLLFFKYTESCVAVLTECLKDESEDVRNTAAEALSKF